MFLSDINYLIDVRKCEVVANCACGHPVAGIAVDEQFDPTAARKFFAQAFLDHLKAENAYPQSTGHALSLDVHPDVEVTGPIDAYKG